MQISGYQQAQQQIDEMPNDGASDVYTLNDSMNELMDPTKPLDPIVITIIDGPPERPETLSDEIIGHFTPDPVPEERFTNIFKDLSNPSPNPVPPQPEPAPNPGIFGWLLGILGDAGNAISDVAGQVGDFLGNLGNAIFDVVGEVGSFLGNLGNAISNLFSGQPEVNNKPLPNTRSLEEVAKQFGTPDDGIVGWDSGPGAPPEVIRNSQALAK